MGRLSCFTSSHGATGIAYNQLGLHDDVAWRVDAAIDQVDKKLDDISETLTTSLGLWLHANVRHESVQKLDALEQRIKRLEERV